MNGTVPISVAMATYNGARYIEEQLDSLATQSCLPCELVVTDDGSTDGTVAIIEAFAEIAPFKTLIYKNPERLGFAANFLKAASLCSSELIAFCDQDDVWLDSKLQTCENEFQNNSVLLCIHSSRIWHDEPEHARHWPDFARKAHLIPNTADPLTVYPGFSMVIRRTLFEISDNIHRPTNVHSLPWGRHQMSHDQWAWFLASIFGIISCVPECLAFYRQHGHNVYGASPARTAIQNMQRSTVSLNYHELANLNEEYAVFLQNWSLTLPPQHARNAEIAAARFLRRAAFQNIRATIYDEANGFFKRVTCVARLLSTGGYLPDKSRMRPGPRAALKDVLFGLPGLHKMRPK